MKSFIQKSTQLILSLILTSACIPPLDKSPLDLALFAGMSLFSKSSIISVSIETLEGENFQLKLEGGPSDNLLDIPTNGIYSFPKPLKEGTEYTIGIVSPPVHNLQSCVVEPESGIAGKVEVHFIQCTTIGYPIRVNVKHLGPNASLGVMNNGVNHLIGFNGIFTFTTDVLIGNSYNVTLVSQPLNHTCSLSGPLTGVITNSPIVLEANCFSPISFQPYDYGLLSPYVPLRIVFSGPIATDASGLAIQPSSTLTTDGGPLFSFQVTQTHIPNDTLQISPQSGYRWQAGSSQFIFNMVAADSSPMPQGVTTVNYIIPSEVRYVSTTGSDANSGLTPNNPKRNIQPAINSIGTCPSLDCLVLIEEGTYSATITGHDFINLVNGISLEGGFIPGTNFTQKNYTADGTKINMPTPNATCFSATISNPCRAIQAGNTITSATMLNYLQIESMQASYTTAILIFGGSPSINFSKLKGGQLNGAAYGESYGIHAINSNFDVYNSEVQGGTCGGNDQSSFGIYVQSTTSSTPNIISSSIIGGVCDVTNGQSVGLQLDGSGTLNLGSIKYNTIQGADHPNNINTHKSIGATVSNTSTTGNLVENTIRAGKARNCIGVNKKGTGTLNLGHAPIGSIVEIPECYLEAMGIFIENGIANIINTTITVGNVGFNSSPTYTKATGVHAFPGSNSFKIERSRIYMGTIAASSSNSAWQYGINAQNSNINTIRETWIQLGSTTHGNSASETMGIQHINDGSNIINNIITGGNTPYRFVGIYSPWQGSEMKIQYNTIRVGTGDYTNSYALDIGGEKNIVQNNIFYYDLNPAGTCIKIANSPSLPTGSIRNNNFYNCNNKLYNQATSKNYTDICPGVYPVLEGTLGEESTSCSVLNILANHTNLQDNTNLNPMLQAPTNSTPLPGNFSPTNNTPCSIVKSSFAIGTIGIDFFGNPRPTMPNGPSMGAIHWNGSCVP